MENWSNLPNDLLQHVSSSLSLPDHNRFSAVCKNWRLVAKEKRVHPFARQLPWVVLGEDPATKKRNFFNLSEQKAYSIDIPELYGQYICGSSYGWLFTLDKEIKCRLVNPFTRERIELPPLPPYSHTREIELTEEPVYNSEGKEVGYTFKEMQSLMIRRAVLSRDPRERPDFTAMIIFGEYSWLAIWRPGDTSWTIVKNPPEDLICLWDVICCQGNFYALSSSNNLFAVDVGPDPKITRIEPSLPWFKNTSSDRYLVDFRGELLLVLRFKRFSRKPTKELRVVGFDLKNGTWEEWEDIYDQAMFVGNNSAMVVDPSLFFGCVKNGIYFTDMLETYYWVKKGHDYGVYDMVDETVERFGPIDSALIPSDAPLVWVMPL